MLKSLAFLGASGLARDKADVTGKRTQVGWELLRGNVVHQKFKYLVLATYLTTYKYLLRTTYQVLPM